MEVTFKPIWTNNPWACPDHSSGQWQQNSPSRSLTESCLISGLWTFFGKEIDSRVTWSLQNLVFPLLVNKNKSLFEFCWDHIRKQYLVPGACLVFSRDSVPFFSSHPKCRPRSPHGVTPTHCSVVWMLPLATPGTALQIISQASRAVERLQWDHVGDLCLAQKT